MNLPAVKAIYTFEMARARRTLMQSIVSPVVSTSLYFVVFGAAIGSRISEIEGVSYGAFIVPGLIMLMLLTQSIANASFGIYFPRFAGHDFRDLVGADLGVRDRDRLCRRGGDQIHHSRPDRAGDGLAVRSDRDQASVFHVVFLGVNSGHVQPVRLHFGALGRRLREAAARAAC